MEVVKTPYTSVLTIAGSDSGGCAGIQADIKSISACGAFAASVITATTAQNTQGVLDIHPIPVAHIEKQLEAVLSDITFGSIKIGMLHSSEVILAIQKKITSHKNIVLDPVMVTTSGDKLITDDAIDTLKTFLPKATLITPNIPEAMLLMDCEITKDNIATIAKKIGKTFHTSVLIKGGHLKSTADIMIDVLYNHQTETLSIIENPIVKTINTHGTGCSLSSSIATFLSLGNTLEEAVKKGCSYVNSAILSGSTMVLGKGNGPINHFDLK